MKRTDGRMIDRQPRPWRSNDHDGERERRIFSRWYSKKEQGGGRNKVGIKFLDRGEK